jgi:hypothetical protein
MITAPVLAASGASGQRRHPEGLECGADCKAPRGTFAMRDERASGRSEAHCSFHEKATTYGPTWTASRLPNPDKPEPRDRLMLAWLLFEAGGSAEAANANDAKCRHSDGEPLEEPEAKTIVSSGP